MCSAQFQSTYVKSVVVHHPGFLHLIASVLFSSDTLQCTVEEECQMFAQNVAEFLVSVQISVWARLVQAWKGHCVYRLHFISESIHYVLFVILGVIVFLRGAGVNLWWDCSVGTVVCTNCKS